MSGGGAPPHPVAPHRDDDAAGRIVVARAPHDASVVAGERFAPVVGAVRVRSENAGGPLAQVAEEVFDPVRTGSGRTSVARCRRVVRATEDRPRVVGSGRAPWIASTVGAARGLLPFRFRRQPETVDAAVVARAEPRDLDGGMALGTGVRAP